MNKGLKHITENLILCYYCCKRNTDLMNKGLKLIGCSSSSSGFPRKETLTWWIRDWNYLHFPPFLSSSMRKETLTWWIRDWNSESRTCSPDSKACKRNTDLMNKGLKPTCRRMIFLLSQLDGCKRNTDLMNKGLKPVVETTTERFRLS